MPITRISSQSLGVLDEHRRLTVHSIFDSAVNLRAGNRLVSCSAAVISSPYGIEMTAADLSHLQRRCCATPDVSLEWHSADRTMVSGTGEVVIASTADVAVFDPTLASARSTNLGDAAAELVTYLARRRADTGLGADWWGLAERTDLTGAVDSLTAGTADRRVLHWLGRGPGLTPSGDDVLVGMLAALWFVGAVDSRRLEPLRRLLEEGEGALTTDLSVEYLYYACRGMFTGVVIDLLVALDRSDQVAAHRALDRLGRYGHTSGWDCTLGMVTALRRVSRADWAAAR